MPLFTVRFPLRFLIVCMTLLNLKARYFRFLLQITVPLANGNGSGCDLDTEILFQLYQVIQDKTMDRPSHQSLHGIVDAPNPYCGSLF